MRKPVRSTVANRKYFQGGGLAPMKPAAPEEAVGIMASSQPLVDMVAQSAGNPQGGMSPLNFNQGGSVFLRQANQVPTESSILNFNQRDLKKRLVPTLDIPKRKPGFSIDVPETGSRLEKILKTKINLPSLLPGALSGVPSQILGTKVNLPLRSPFKGIAQYFGSDPADEGGIASRFPTASSSQLATLDALAQMNPNNKDEIYSLGEKIITDDKSEATGEDLANLMKSEKLMLDKKADDELDRIQKEANEQARKEAEGKAPEIDPITDKQKKDSEELIEKEKSKTSVVKKSEDDETIDNVENITGSEEKKDPTQDPVKQGEEPKTAMDETIQNINKNAEEGNQEATTKSIEDYTEEFKKAMPKFEGMTEEEKGYAIMEAGLAIMGGQSPRALENISNGLQPLVKKFTKNKEQERVYTQQINIAAAKYGVQKSDADRAREMALADAIAAEGRAFAPGRVVLKPFTFKGKKYGEKDIFEFTRADMETEEFKNIPPGTLASESVYKEIMANKRNVDDNIALIEKTIKEAEIEQSKQGVNFTDFKSDMTDYREDNKVFYEGMNQRVILGQAAQLFVDDPEAILGAKGYVADVLDRTLNLANVKTDRGKLARLAKNNKQMFNAKMREIGTKMLTQILNEGTKTVSDADRERVQQLVSEITDLAAASANPEVIKMKLLSLDKAIAKGIRDANTGMKQIENRYTKNVRVKGLPELVTTDELEIIRKTQQDPDFVTGSEGQEFNYTDIWDPKADDGQGNFIGEFKV